MKINVSKLLLKKPLNINEISIERTGFYYLQDDRTDLTEQTPFLYVKLREKEIIDPEKFKR